VRRKGPLGNERPFLSTRLFALFYQAEIRHPQLLKKQTAPLGGAFNAAIKQCNYGKSIVAVSAAICSINPA
jgi:hypothetical protein